MVCSVAAGAVLIAGLNAHTAVRSVQARLLPCACWAALLAHKSTHALALSHMLIKHVAPKRKG